MTTEDDKDLHTRCMDRYEELHSYWNSKYEQMNKDVRFMLGEGHWEDGRTYEPDKLKLIINKCEAEVDAIVNEMRASRPSIDTAPVDDSGDVDISDIIDGLLRNTEHDSDAASAYDTAAFTQVPAGLGFFRINLEYIKGTFDQEPKILPIEDFSSVLIDNLSVALDGSDMRDAFVVNNDIPKSEFKKMYPKKQPESFNHMRAGWCTDKTVRIAEYFYTETEKETLYQVDLGGQITVMREKDVEEYNQTLKETLGPLNIINERDEEVKLIKWCKLSGSDILEKTDWVGEWVPIIPVYGKMIFVNGERKISGVIKVLKDPQRLLNYWESYNTETAALQPKAPWSGYDEVIEGFEDIYKDSNNKNYPFMPAKAVIKNGVLLPPPQRQMPPALSPVLQQQSMMAMQYIKAVTGKVYDEGQKTLGSESGKAIIAKERKSDVASFHYIDNQSKSIRHAGKILVDLYPKVYSPGQVKRILGQDGESEPIRLDKNPNKIEGIYDIWSGKYDVTVKVGPSYTSQRQEFAESMIQLATAVPQVMAACSDIIVRNMDFHGAQEAADRLKKTLPPGLADDEQTPEQAALMQATQAVNLLKTKLVEMDKQLQDKTRSEDQKHKIDLINADLKKQEIEIKAFEASIKAMQAQAAANERLQPQDWAQIVTAITGIDERVNDITSAFELLLDADEGASPQPLQ